MGVIVFCAGCGGLNPSGSGDVSGAIFNETGDVVRGARVWADDNQTLSNSTGGYVITNVRNKFDVVVRAEITVGGVRYFGQNVARIPTDARLKSLNIAVYPDSEQATIEGTVADRTGLAVEGAHVFARQNNGAVVSSSLAITDSDGHYRIEGLKSGQEYALVANAQGFDSDSDVVTLNQGEDRTENFVIPDATGNVPPPPTNLSATSWTSPKEVTRSLQLSRGIEAIKRMLDPRRTSRHVAAAKARDSATGDVIEVDLFWDRPDFQSLLGFGIYRGPDPTALTGIDFLRDPLSDTYEDSDRELTQGQEYSYAASSLSTSYTSHGHGESALSSVVHAPTLGQVVALQPSFGPLTFHWSLAYGAQQYEVLVYDQYPAVGVPSGFHFFSNQTTDTSYVYGGPALQSGKTYFFAVLGSTNDGAGMTLSRIESFVMP